MDSELFLKFIAIMGISQATFQHCRIRFYTFFGQPLSKQLYTVYTVPVDNTVILALSHVAIIKPWIYRTEKDDDR